MTSWRDRRLGHQLDIGACGRCGEERPETELQAVWPVERSAPIRVCASCIRARNAALGAAGGGGTI